MIYNQKNFDIKTEWGFNGLLELSKVSDVIIIVDILSFSTCVDIITANDSYVFPYKYNDDSSKEYTKTNNAILADTDRNSKGYSLSPYSLINIPSQIKIVLPSPNGSTLSLHPNLNNSITLCGCIRNAKSVAEYATTLGKNISLIASGEKWKDQSLRPSLEDILGVGAIISYLKGTLSPESLSAKYIFEGMKNEIFEHIKNSSSGNELIYRGFLKDVELACQLNISNCVPILKNNYYLNAVKR